MSEFSNPAPRPRIPETVPLTKASKERQDLYGPLTEMDRTQPEALPAQNIPFPKPASEMEPSGGMQGEPQPPETEPEISAEDRQAFLASVLAHKPYEKNYTLFGKVVVTFRDRTPLQVENIQAMLNTSEVADETELAILEERLILATEMVSISYGQTGEPFPSDPAKLRENADAIMAKFTKPLYQAILGACREFDRHVSQLTRRALDKDFWQAGTASSPSQRTAPARSTSPATAVATSTGR